MRLAEDETREDVRADPRGSGQRAAWDVRTGEPAAWSWTRRHTPRPGPSDGQGNGGGAARPPTPAEGRHPPAAMTTTDADPSRGDEPSRRTTSGARSRRKPPPEPARAQSSTTGPSPSKPDPAGPDPTGPDPAATAPPSDDEPPRRDPTAPPPPDVPRPPDTPSAGWADDDADRAPRRATPPAPQAPPDRPAVRDTTVAPAFGDFVHVVRRYRWSVLFAVVAVLGVALAFSLTSTPMYQADAALLVRPVVIGGQETTINMVTEEEVIQSNVIADRAATILGVEGGGSSIISGLDASAVEDTEILEISYTADSRAKARERAEAFVQAYRDNRQELSDQAYEQARAAIEEELDALNETLDEVRSQLAGAGEGEQDDLQSQLNQISNRIVERQLELTEARSTGPVAEVLRAAETQSSAVSPDPIRDGTTGLVIGLLLGLSVAVLRDQLDDRVRDVADVVRVLHAPSGFAIPPHDASAKADAVTARASMGEDALEAYRALAIDVAATLRRTDQRSVLVTGAHRGAGASTLATQLAITLARSGRLVLLVSADIRDPSVERQLGTGEAPGLVDVLERRVKPADAVQRTAVPRLYVMPAGSHELRAPELLASRGMESVVGLLEDAADIVVYDTPPVGERADALAAAGAVGRAIVVAGAEVTRPVLASTARQLRQVGAEIVAGVVTRADDAWRARSRPS